MGCGRTDIARAINGADSRNSYIFWRMVLVDFAVPFCRKAFDESSRLEVESGKPPGHNG